MRGPQSLPARPWLSDGPLRLNTLLWPSGASRWSVFHALVDDASMDKIRGATGSFGQPLTIDDGVGPVLSVTMYPLPPRPLSQIPGANGLQLLTLLDRRAYWPWLAADVGVVGGTTTWAGLFATIAAALGVTLAVDDVPAAYLSPPAALSGAYDSLPALLDAACLSCGLRFAAALDGTSYRCWSVAAARQQAAANLAAVTKPRAAGGIFLQGADLNGILPAAVRVVFPRADGGIPNPAPVVVPVTLASLNLPSNPPGGPAVGGIGGLTKTFHSSAVATFVSGSATNAAALAALATQAATDFYAWQATAYYDVAYAGVAPWLPTGADGLCEYAHSPDARAGGGILSRFRRDSYFDGQESLWHHTVTPCAAIPTRARVVGTTLTDGCLFAAELVVRSGCADTPVSPAVAAWLRIDGATDPPVPGDVHLASPEGVRAADALPVYVAQAGAAAGGVTLYRATYHPDGSFNTYLPFTSPLSPLSLPTANLEVVCQNGLNVDLRTHGTVVRPAVAIDAASATGPGVVTIDPQTFAGDKTFTGDVSTASLATGAITCSSIAGGTATFGEALLNGTSVGGTLDWVSNQWANAPCGQIVAGYYASGPLEANSRLNFFTYHVTGSGPGVTVSANMVLGTDGSGGYLNLAGSGLYRYRIGNADGKYGTDPVGNVFSGGLCTTVGGGGAAFVSSVGATSPLGNTGTAADPVIGIVSSTGSGLVALANAPTLTDPAVNQAANGDTALTLTRATDTAPAGNFETFKTAGGSTLWNVDANGHLTDGVIDEGTWT